MKLYWYKLEKDKITEEEVEVKRKGDLYKMLYSGHFPHDVRAIIERTREGEILCGWKGIFVFFAEKNLEKARGLFVEYQKQIIADKEKQIQELERQIDKLEEIDVQHG